MLIRRLVELLAPAQCVECGRDGQIMCWECAQTHVLARAAECPWCRLHSPAGATCESCSPLTPLSGATVAAYYDGPVKELIWQLKFKRLRSAADASGDMIVAALPSPVDMDAVTSVPITAGRYRERGYNQSELVARRVAARLALPYSPLLGRTTASHQVGLTRRDRLEQVQGAFYARRRADGFRVLVVDDVITTGATLSECAGVLAGVGAESVWGAAVARH